MSQSHFQAASPWKPTSGSSTNTAALRPAAGLSGLRPQGAGTRTETGWGPSSHTAWVPPDTCPLPSACLGPHLCTSGRPNPLQKGKSPYLPHRTVVGVPESHTSCSAQCLAHSEGSEKTVIITSTHYPCLRCSPFTPCKSREQHLCFPSQRPPRVFVSPPPLNKSLLRSEPSWSPSPGQKRLCGRAGGGEEDGRERPASGPRGAPGSRDRPGARAAAAARSPPARPLGVARARGGRGHGHARRPVGARREGAGKLRAPVRPPAAVGGGVGCTPRAAATAAAAATSLSHKRPSSSSSLGRPAPPTPRRTCAAERERNKLCSTVRQKAKSPHATASAHTRAPSPVYITATQPNLLRPGRAGW